MWPPPACWRTGLTNLRGELGSSSSAAGLRKAMDVRVRLRSNATQLSELKSEQKEAPMNVRSDRSVIKRRIKDQGKTRSAKPRVQGTEWELTDELTDERLDEALRQTFPASDALSIIQNVRGN